MGHRTDRWARDHDRCRTCGTTDRPHRARGLCGHCYNEAHNRRHKRPNARQGRRRDGLTARVTERELRELYVEHEMSLQEIADRFGCTSPLVLYMMKRHSIPRRSHSEARRNAQRDGKVRYTRRLTSGETRVIRPRSTSINERFFHGWSPQMAYVLGVFYTDGCLTAGKAGYLSASISQKEPELLEKCLALMKCDAPLTYRPNNSPAGGLYTFAVNHQNVCMDLVALGLHPRKSRTIQFPEAPAELHRHFIRGCWDGDGSVCKLGERPSTWRASYVSASSGFIAGIRDSLVSQGMPSPKIYLRHATGVFSFYWAGTRCRKLFHILYDGVPEGQYLLRKYLRFRAAAAENGDRLARPPLANRRV